MSSYWKRKRSRWYTLQIMTFIVNKHLRWVVLIVISFSTHSIYQFSHWLAESTADRWRQRFEKKKKRKLFLNLAGEFSIKDQHKRKPKRLSTF